MPHASAALELVFGSSPPALTGSAAEDLHDNLSKMSTALSSERSFKTVLETDGIFADETDHTATQISDIFDARDTSL